MNGAFLLTPLILGNGVPFPRIIPGPMDGVTEGSFVSVLTSRGYVWNWHTPFLRISTGVPARSRLKSAIGPYLETGLPVTVQLMGASSERLTETARRLFELGVACVDLNCACPSQTVLGNDSGGARLRNLPWLRQTLSMMREACGRNPISVKVRVGFESPDEFPAIAEAIRAGKPDCVIVHYRTVREMYHPIEGGLERLTRAVECLEGIPVYGSGDLFTVSDCIRMAESTGVAGIAPARGLIKNPRLLVDTREFLDKGGGTKAPALKPLEFMLEIAEAALTGRHQDNGFVLRLCKAMCGAESEVFRHLVACRTLQKTVACLEEFLGDTTRRS